MRWLCFSLLLACGGPPPAAIEPPVAAESEDCRQERLAILADAEASRQRSCDTDADCAVATNPGHPSRELAIVVHASDAAGLDARSIAHLSRCGAFHHHEAIDAIPVIEARCRTQCTAEESVLHVEPL